MEVIIYSAMSVIIVLLLGTTIKYRYDIFKQNQKIEKQKQQLKGINDNWSHNIIQVHQNVDGGGSVNVYSDAIHGLQNK
jgi:hypothetical protein